MPTLPWVEYNIYIVIIYIYIVIKVKIIVTKDENMCMYIYIYTQAISCVYIYIYVVYMKVYTYTHQISSTISALQKLASERRTVACSHQAHLPPGAQQAIARRGET